MLIKCPGCGTSFRKGFWRHVKKCHPELNEEDVILKVMELTEWPVYEIDGVIKRYKFDKHGCKFQYQSVSDGAKISVNKRFENPDERNKISKALKSRYDSDPELHEKLSNGLRERSKNQDYLKKLSEGQKRRYEDPEVRKRLSEQVHERYKDPEYSKKCSEAIRMSRINDPTITKRISETLRKRFESEEAHVKASESHKKMHADNPDLSKNHSEWMKNHYKETGDYLGALSKEYRDKHMNNGIWTSGAECKFITVLKELGYEVIGEGTPLNTTNSKFFADALIKINDTIIDVEIDGPWCHDNRYERDVYRDTEIHESFGYKIFRLNSNIASYLSDKDKINAVLMDVVNNDVYYNILTTKDLVTKWRDSKIKLIDVVNSTDHTV